MPVPRRDTIRDYKRWHPQAHEEVLSGVLEWDAALTFPNPNPLWQVFPLEKKRTLKSKGDSMRSQSTEPTMSMSLTRKDIEDMMPEPLAPLYVPGGVVGTNLVSRETAPSAEQVEKYKTALAMVNEELRRMDETEARRAAEAFYGAQTLPSHRSRSQTGGRRSARPRATKFPSGFNVPTTMDFNPDERPILAQNLRKLTPGDYGDRPYPELIHRKGATSRIHPGGQFECASKSKAVPRNLREQGGAGILRFPTANMAK